MVEHQDECMAQKHCSQSKSPSPACNSLLACGSALMQCPQSTTHVIVVQEGIQQEDIQLALEATRGRGFPSGEGLLASISNCSTDACLVVS
jgi:hypothetical protein